MKRIVFFGNNWTAWKTLEWLKEQNIELVALVIHPESKQKFTKELINASQLPDDRIICATSLKEEATIHFLKSLNANIGVSVLFDYILSQECIDLFPEGIINSHPSFLPYNRGQYPNVWSIIDGSPAGVTLHYIDKGIDTGDIITQRTVTVEPTDTGISLYKKLELCALDVFKEEWPQIACGKAKRSKQGTQAGTYHKTKDVDSIDHIELEKKYSAKELIDIIRARTFPPYKGAFFEKDGKRVYIRMELKYEDDL